MSRMRDAAALSALFPATALASGSAEPALRSTTDPRSQLIVGAIVVGVFALLALEKVHRVLVVLGAVALIWGITYLTPFRLLSFDEARQALDLNVLLLLAAMMAVVGVLKTTGVFEWSVARLMNRAGGDPYLVLASVVWLTGVLSAFCDNVTTVIFVTPMAIQMSRAMGVRPAALLLPVVMASNIGGTATLIGDPPNIMIGSGAGLTFLDFILNVSAPVAVMMCALPWFSARYFRAELGRGRRAGVTPHVPVPAIADPPLLRWALWIVGGIFVGFLTHGRTGMPTAVPAIIGVGALLLVQDVLYLRRVRPTHAERQHGVLTILERDIEWPTLAFFAFLFIAVGAAVATGLIDTLARGLTGVIRDGSVTLGLGAAGTLLFAALLIAWVSGLLSSVIDNIPFVAVMIPIIHRLTGEFAGDPTVLWWALSLGACLGGNGTAVGASANVTTVGIAERAGERIAFGEFARFGARVAALTLGVASAYLATHVFLGARGALVSWTGLVALLAAAQLVTRRGARLRPQAAAETP